LSAQRHIRCWGQGPVGQLGNGSDLTLGDDPNEIGEALRRVDLGVDGAGEPVGAIQVVAGSNFSCALTEAGEVKCFGDNGSGQLGRGDTVDSVGNKPSELGAALRAVPLGTGRRALELSAAGQAVCALLDNGSIKCWGDNSAGQLGQGDLLNRGRLVTDLGDHLPPVALGEGRHAVQLSIGPYHGCAVLDNGSVKCWGDNAFGKLGLGDTRSRGGRPGELGDLLPALDLGKSAMAVRVSASISHTCAQLEDTTVKCWGFGGGGGLGNGALLDVGDQQAQMGDALRPVALEGARRAMRMTAGYGASCLLRDDGVAACFGFNWSGLLAIESQVDRRGGTPSELGDGMLPVRLPVAHGRIVDLVMSAGQPVACAQMASGSIFCWGRNYDGILGQGTSGSADADKARGDGPGEMEALLPIDLGPSALHRGALLPKR
jgi:alpha-tubulin suppressor-like RCC1 family protein